MLTVIGLLSGLAVGSLDGLQGSRQDIAATRVRSMLVYAQGWARDSGNDTWVAFDTGANLVSAFVEDPANPGSANRLTLADPLDRKAMTLALGSDGVGLTSVSFGGTDEVHFDELGAPHDELGSALAADGTVVLSGSRTVRVTRNTGLVTID